jgi:SMODS-associated and fused to various effectors sensor domain/CHAT domain
MRFQKSLAHVEGQKNQGLRIRLNFDLDNPDLVAVAALPWELIRDGSKNDFLCLIPRTPLLRYLPMDRPPVQEFEGPLKILVVQSAPKDLDPIDLEAEWRKLWKELGLRPGIEVDSIRHSSIEGMYRKLNEEPWHVLHFLGHGDFDQEAGQGRLCFEKAAGRAERITGRILADHLKSFPDLRLVVLNACRSGMMPRHKGHDPFNSVAPALIQAGIPAVIAMQCPISYSAATAFGANFYHHIVAGDPVDAAMVKGRLAILRDCPYDWGNPVLFTRVADGDILGPMAQAPSPSVQMTRPLRLGIRTFSETPGKVLYGKEMEEECGRANILDLRSFFTGPGGRYIKDAALWQTKIVPRLRKFLQPVPSSRRPIHLNFASHSSLAFAAGYFLEAKSGVEVTIRQRGQAGVAEWRAFAGADRKGALFLRENDLPGAGESHDIAVALSMTHAVLPHVQHYLKTAQLAIHRILPVTLAPKPSLLGVQDGLHAFRLAEGIAQKLRERPSSESGGTVHLFAAAPNAMLFFLGQLCQGLGRIQLYEYDFHSGGLGAYSPSILLSPTKED